MTKRQRIKAKIEAKDKQIVKLHAEMEELRKQDLLLCDKLQWYTEGLEPVGRGKKKREVLMGWVHWMEDFVDEATGEVVPIERKRVVKVDESWQRTRLIEETLIP